MELAQYTEIYEGLGVRWYAESAELVAALVAVGYACDAHQGVWALAEPSAQGDAYSALCGRVSPVDGDDIPAGTLVEELAYDPALVGRKRMRCTGDLYQAVWNATA